MKVIKYDPDEHRFDVSLYPAYIDSVRAKLPPGALAFAEAKWHYDASSHYCPHDSWIKSVDIIEDKINRKERRVDIRIRLIGSYHDGEIEIFYQKVSRYSLSGRLNFRGHGDLMIDEILLEDDGQVSHEIALEASTWIIICTDLSFRWIPYEEVKK